MTTFYIEKNGSIVLHDDNRQRLVNTLAFMPEFFESDIQQTDGFIVDGVIKTPEEYAGIKAEELAEQELQQKKADRAEAVEAITSTVDGNIFEGDEVSQGRMARAVIFAMANASIVNNERKLAYEQAIAGLTPEEAEAVPKPVYDNYLEYTHPWVTEGNRVVQVTIGQLAKAGAESMLIQADLWTVPYES